MKIYKHFETPEEAMAWASVKFIPNVNAIRATLARGEDYTAEVKNWDLEVVLTLTDAITHLEQQGMKRLNAKNILDQEGWTWE